MLMQQLPSHSTQYAAESKTIKREQQTEARPCHLCSGMVYKGSVSEVLSALHVRLHGHEKCRGPPQAGGAYQMVLGCY